MPEPTLLLLHGFLGRGADWGAVVHELEGVRVLAPDLPGHGESVGLAELDYGMERASARLVAHLDDLGIARVVLAGYSMGGRLALYFALQHPGRVSSLVLISASAGLATEVERHDRRTLDAVRAEAVRTDLASFLEAWVRMPLFRGLSEPQRAAMVADRLAHNHPEELGKSLNGMGAGAQPWLGARLDELTMPVLFIAGAKDDRYIGLSNELAAGRPFRVEIVPNASHALLTEAPGEIARLLASRL